MPKTSKEIVITVVVTSAMTTPNLKCQLMRSWQRGVHMTNRELPLCMKCDHRGFCWIKHRCTGCIWSDNKTRKEREDSYCRQCKEGSNWHIRHDTIHEDDCPRKEEYEEPIIDHENMDLPVCPKCGFELSDHDTRDLELYEDERETDIICPKCFTEYNIEVRVEPMYFYTTKLVKEEDRTYFSMEKVEEK